MALSYPEFRSFSKPFFTSWNLEHNLQIEPCINISQLFPVVEFYDFSADISLNSLQRISTAVVARASSQACNDKHRETKTRKYCISSFRGPTQWLICIRGIGCKWNHYCDLPDIYKYLITQKRCRIKPLVLSIPGSLEGTWWWCRRRMNPELPVVALLLPHRGEPKNGVGSSSRIYSRSFWRSLTTPESQMIYFVPPK